MLPDLDNIQSINLVPEKELELMFDEFNKVENKNKIIIPDIPYSYFEIVREMNRRENEKDEISHWE